MVFVKLILTTLTLAAACHAAALSSSDPKEVQIVSQMSDMEPDGSYKFAYEASDGSKAAQEGHVKTVGDEQVVVAQGQFSYLDADGQVVTVTWIADENGFQPLGDHLPVPPPIPDLIQKSLAFLATAPPPKE